MDSQDENKESSESHRPQDGGIDFSSYSTEQLTYLRSSINRETHPEDFRSLVEELARRAERAAGGDPEISEYAVRFTRWQGIVGWIQALIRRAPLYGAGAVRLEAGHVVLRGWQRTWLAVPLEAEILLDADHIRNVVREDRWVRFESCPPKGRRRQFECEAASDAAASAIVESLPQSRTEGFDAAWRELRAFGQALKIRTPRTWAAPLLVALNVLVFLALVIAGAGFWAPDPQVLTQWGSNFGWLVLNGEWFRLFSAVFLHASVVHLAVNMWVLWSVGRLVERLYGTAAFVFLYVCTGIVASLSSVAWDPFQNSVGASGAIFGVLGACLVFLARRKASVPWKVVRAHGPSTLAFVLFSLVSGMLSANVDNAAHVGGLIAGCLLGWFLVRPLDAQVRIGLSPAQIAGACMVAFVALAAGAWQIHDLRSSRSAPERYWTSHQWLMSGQVQPLSVAAELQMRASNGSISKADFIHRLENEVLSFWQEAHARLADEPASDDKEVQKFAVLVTEFVRLRRDAAVAGVEAVRDEDGERMRDSVDYARQADQAAARVARLEMRAQAGRFHSLSQRAVPRAIRKVFASVMWTCVLPMDSAHGELQNLSANDGKQGRIAGGCAAQRAFRTGDYDRLDAMLHPRPSEIADMDDGDSRLTGLIGGLTDLFEQEQSLEVALARLGDWRRERPDSDGPDIVEAMLFRSWAWSVRGEGYTDTVSSQQWQLFAQRIAMAQAALDDAKDRPLPSPVWYQLALQLGLDGGLSNAELRAIFDAGAARYPDYYGLHSAMLRVLMPRWKGSYGEVDNFIEEIVRRTSEARGPEMYARLYSIFAVLEGDDTDLFEEAYARWPTMKQGYEDLLSRYPQSDSIKNAYAQFACRASDAETYRAARIAMNGIIATAWTPKHSPETCDKSLL